MNFNDTKIAFATRSRGDLLNARVLFTLIKSPRMVIFFKFMTNLALKIRFPVGWIVKPTLYRQFVGGEKLEECQELVEKLAEHGVMSVLDFSAEGGASEERVENAYNELLRSIEFAAQHREQIPYAVFKPTALVRQATFNRAAELGLEQLSQEERVEMERFKERFMALCKRAYDLDIRILIDAEHYLTQEIIDRLVEEAMELYNGKRAIVFQTLQMYRLDRLDYLKRLHQEANEKGYFLGIKFVRGAYMEEERELAEKRGYSDPINPTKEATDKLYDDGLRYVMDHIDQIELFNGTHNYESNYLLAQLIEEKGLERSDNRIFFSQLYGMSDNISFTLAAEGYNICKYLPYAPVREVLPYLLRRAEENTSMAGQTGRELTLIKEELARRKREK